MRRPKIRTRGKKRVGMAKKRAMTFLKKGKAKAKSIKDKAVGRAKSMKSAMLKPMEQMRERRQRKIDMPDSPMDMQQFEESDYSED